MSLTHKASQMNVSMPLLNYYDLMPSSCKKLIDELLSYVHLKIFPSPLPFNSLIISDIILINLK